MQPLELSSESHPIFIPLHTAFPSWTTPVAVRRPIPFSRFAELQRPGFASSNMIQELKHMIEILASSSVLTTDSILDCLKQTRKTPDNLQVAYLLSYLGAQLLAQNNAKDAEIVHRRALCIGAARLGGDDPELSYSLDWLGLTIYTQGNYNEALLLCYATKALVEGTMGENHLNICGCLMNMALVFDAKGWFLYAWHLREEATRILMNIITTQ